MPANTESPSVRGRGRPRAFDRALALRGAMSAFWEKGFDATSMNDLVDSMGINSPSIYAAFGSKEDLFREAVDLYANTEGGASKRAMLAPGSAKEAIHNMLAENVKLFADPVMPRGCMIVLGAVNIGTQNASLLAFVSERRREITTLVSNRLNAALGNGELRPNTNVDVLTALVITVLNGISIQALDEVPRRILLDAVKMFTASLPLVSVNN